MIDKDALMEAHDCHFGTPLHVACARQHVDCVKVLLNAGEFFYYCESWNKIPSSHDRLISRF